MTLRTKGVDSTNALHAPHDMLQPGCCAIEISMTMLHRSFVMFHIGSPFPFVLSFKSVCWSTIRFMEQHPPGCQCDYCTSVQRHSHLLQDCDFDRQISAIFVCKTDENSRLVTVLSQLLAQDAGTDFLLLSVRANESTVFKLDSRPICSASHDSLLVDCEHVCVTVTVINCHYYYY